MSILDQLSSQVGDRTADADKRVAELCIERPELLEEIAEGLGNESAPLAADCAEVMTDVALVRPELVAPYADNLVPLLSHKNTRARWEATHALSLVATLAPVIVASILPKLEEMIRTDPSIIVRDYAVDALSSHAGSTPEAAGRALPALKEALSLWDGRHAHHAWPGLTHVARSHPGTVNELRLLATEDLDAGRAAVQKAARAFLRATRG